MNAKYIKHRFFYLFVLIGLILSFTNCTSDDDGDIPSKTWLEIYDGTKWEDGNDLYWRIIDDTNTILESWYQDGPCYIHRGIDDRFTIKIIENSANKLVFQVIANNTETMTFRVNGDTLTVLFEYNDKSETITFKKTTVDVDDFTICS